MTLVPISFRQFEDGDPGRECVGGEGRAQVVGVAMPEAMAAIEDGTIEEARRDCVPQRRSCESGRNISRSLFPSSVSSVRSRSSARWSYKVTHRLAPLRFGVEPGASPLGDPTSPRINSPGCVPAPRSHGSRPIGAMQREAFFTCRRLSIGQSAYSRPSTGATKAVCRGEGTLHTRRLSSGVQRRNHLALAAVLTSR